MKIALVQSHIFWEDRDRNISAFEKIASAHSDADLVLLPEMSFTGFSMNTAKTADPQRETISRISEIAARYQLAVGFGWVRPAGEKCENMYTIVDQNGKIISEYAKIHPFSFSDEDKFFTGGNSVSVYTIGGIPFTTFICYDLRFPEVFRSVCRDVHTVIIPANWPGKRSEHWKTLLRARAIENQVYILAVNCVGEMNGLYYSGDSCVIDPGGNVLASLQDKEGVIEYELADDTDHYRTAFPVLRDIKNNFVYQR